MDHQNKKKDKSLCSCSKTTTKEIIKTHNRYLAYIQKEESLEGNSYT